MGKLSRYIDPRVLAGIAKLDLRAKCVVEGLISGLHRSPFHGYSVEFAEHRSYVPGDDMKHLDWKLLGRADRYYVKLYEEETNLRAYLLLDCSRSMQYRSERAPLSKYDYACTLAASLAYLLLMQQDAVGLVLFDETERRVLPPSSSPAHLQTLCGLMEEAGTRHKTDLSVLFHRLAEGFKRKGIVIVISDLFAPLDDVRRGLQHFRHNRHDVMVFHVMDHQELALELDGNIQFVGLEAEPPLTMEARRIRPAYHDAVHAFREQLESNCRRMSIDCVLMDTQNPIEMALARFLHARTG